MLDAVTEFLELRDLLRQDTPVILALRGLPFIGALD